MTSHQRRAVKPLTFWGVIAPRAGVRQGTSPPLDFKTLESCVAGATDETIVDGTGTGTTSRPSTADDARCGATGSAGLRGTHA